MLQPPQPFERPNEALKDYRDRFEIGFLPTQSQHILDLEPGFLLIRKVTKGKGEEFHFEAGARPVPFSWSQMLLATGQMFEYVVGVGVVAVLMFVRPNSYDHWRGSAFVKQHGQKPENRPQVWDFLVKRADDTGILLHPRWRKSGGIDILPFDGMTDAVSPVPSAGVGKSDGKGTYRRTKNAAYASKAKEPPVVIQLPETATTPTSTSRFGPQPPPPPFRERFRRRRCHSGCPPVPPQPPPFRERFRRRRRHRMRRLLFRFTGRCCRRRRYLRLRRTQ